MITTGNSTTNDNSEWPFDTANFDEHVEQAFSPGREASSTRVDFRFTGFRKGRFDNFDLTASLAINCEPLKYTVHALPERSGKPIMHLYQEALTKDEIKQLTEPMARYILTTIQQKTKI